MARHKAGKTMSDHADPFEWSGGHPALDLVNTLDERPFPPSIENLATYRAFVQFAELANLIQPSLAQRLRQLEKPACARIARRARELREHLYGLLAATHSGKPVPKIHLEAIGAAIRAARAARELVESPTPGLASYRWLAPIAADIPLHACALAIEDLLIHVERNRIRKCGASDCCVYFFDTSKGQQRQWCNMKGRGNREKQRRWRSGSR
jgi:predicted RNA-binding Zn ribbon-like protein